MFQGNRVLQEAFRGTVIKNILKRILDCLFSYIPTPSFSNLTLSWNYSGASRGVRVCVCACVLRGARYKGSVI